ncbi:MAG: stalk domain-containing protein [Bacillota bacterium]
MKKVICMLLTSALLMAGFTVNFAEERPDIKVQVDNEKLTFDVNPMLEDGRVLVPLRGVFEKLGAEVSWNEKTATALIRNKYMRIEVPIGTREAKIYRNFDFTGLPETIRLDVPAKLVDNRTFVPVRFVAESLGATVEWDQQSYTVNIRTDINPVETVVSYETIMTHWIQDIEEIKNWVESNYKNGGIYYKKVDHEIYILVSGGEKPTGGYSVEVDNVTMITPDTAYVAAHVNAPGKGDIVAQVITYPYVLIKIEDENVKDVQGDIDVEL